MTNDYKLKQARLSLKNHLTLDCDLLTIEILFLLKFSPELTCCLQLVHLSAHVSNQNLFPDENLLKIHQLDRIRLFVIVWTDNN